MSTLHVERTGLQLGQGPVALFVHGFPLDHTMWSAQITDLADIATCLAPDLCGFGATPHDGSLKLSMERHADDLARVLDEADVERADVIGLSMGGYVALAMWELHAERFRSLVLVDTHAGADSPLRRDGRDETAEHLQQIHRAAFAREMLPKLVAPDATRAVRDELTSMIENTPVETILAGLRGMRDRVDRSGLLASIDVPTLVVCGELDTLTPPALSEEMVRMLPHGELALIEGAGHMAPMEAPEAVSAVLRAFLLGRARA